MKNVAKDFLMANLSCGVQDIPPIRERVYFNSLTGLQGLAAFLVLVSHSPKYGFANMLGYGDIGAASVAVFFDAVGFFDVIFTY